MPTWLLFLGPTLIWASTWHVILYQLGQVPVLNSVGWRFALAALVLAGLARWQGQSLKLPRSAHGLMLAAGIVQYSGNYWAVYEAEQYIPSGLVAVLFALMVFGNALGAWWAFGQKSSRGFLLAALGGTVGVALVFWPEIAASGARPQASYGLAIGLGAVLAACIGNVLTLTLTRRGLPLLPILAWSMGYGAAFLLLLSVVSGVGLQFDWRWPYVLSWLYLSLFGTVIAFVLYFKLAQRQGPARASLMGVVIPVIALSVSALFEGWRATPMALAGMAMCVGSVWLAQRQPTPTARKVTESS
ncbi:DMT family transporter [Inhella sp.]|uniref:DMT family transporter n=1 Tax=Inhella sp. TaxID=1921806 RepID=UPI0035B3219F